MLAMHNLQSSVQNLSSAVKNPSARSGAGPFRCAPTTTTTTSLFQPHVHGSAIESPSSSDDTQSHSLNDDAADELVNNWHHQADNHQIFSSANAYNRMRRESDRTSPSSATSATFASADLNHNNVCDVIDANSPDGLPPKIEELDDDGEVLMTLKPGDDRSASDAVTSLPRKRGRPRKHPLPVPGGQMKVAKGRSKTGCITCRRRKKKCDETKPACLNCQKNAVVCEGYPPKEIWKSGKQKMADAVRRTSISLLPRGLPILIDGIETEVDRRFLDHFVFDFSRVLTLINDDSNPFKEILLPMATQHRGLMHSLMCLSGSHLSARDPEPRFKERKHYHFDRAITDLRESINAAPLAEDAQEPQLLVEDPIIASTLALCLNTICEGETSGEYRSHMDAARFLLVNQKPKNEKFRQFIIEFFQYHDVSNSLTSLDRRPVQLDGDLRLPDFVPHAQAGTFLGIFDGLFNYISEITRIRDRIRARHSEGFEPAVDYQTLSEAVRIDNALRIWEPSYAKDTPNWYASQLYRQSTWVYLYRTIRPSRPSEKICQVVDDALQYLDHLPQDAGAYSIMLMPLFLIGCSAFLPRQRERIKVGFDAMKQYSSLRNIEPALKVVERVWQVMDTKMEESWDWEKIIEEMHMDFLIT
ncbi:C6 transcription factor OefC [Talaromyces stipitatus ATCC 10500]|uniref:C6 transcription factor OefC n=1 Tax=Talaromyces stipitatus (strain ATCC 10500 / CBS 375.48 / QM 6759 / NRRL 1006) TaxID=441959 RepID=B8M759_TALSN|nr:C6 transcription factor OefC [Talaromyces stipitatus ATCC 10500]EED20279.1 C6 transcription factor OefC [Talaromyces stipitatus ATCC 10500]